MSRTEAARKKAARDLARDPVQGRNGKQYNRITRALEALATRIAFHLEKSDFADNRWLPSENVITEKDDEWQYDLHMQYLEKYNVDEIGYLQDWHDAGIKATNRISAITWYENEHDAGFLIKKSVYCPLSCDRWGRLPITLKQWRIIAPMLIESSMHWQWVHAVRHYAEDPTFMCGNVVGWHLELTNAVTTVQKLKDSDDGYVLDFRSEEEQQQDAEGWTGRNIYLDIIEGFSLDA